MPSSRQNSSTGNSKAHCVACDHGVFHPQAVAGLRLFNAGEYFEAHEALELAWREDNSTIRDLYRGILQVAVMYHHILQQNFRGAIKVYHRCMPWLEPFPTYCRGVDVGSLRHNCQEVYDELARLGPNGISRFDRSYLRPIHFTPPGEVQAP